jgi:uncharacterized protein YbaP (TraB family)
MINTPGVNPKIFVKYISLGILMTLFLACSTGKNGLRQDKPLENALLWKLEGKDITKPSYIFGTMHMIDAEDYFLPDGTMTAIDQTQQMVFEIDMNEMSDMSSIMGMMNKLFMNDNLTIKDLLSPEDYKLVSDHFNKAGLPMFMMERIKPMFLSVFAQTQMDPNGLQKGTLKSYEMEFVEMANDSKKKVLGLETMDFQISLFDAIPYDAQAKMLVDAVKASSEEASDEMARLTQLYLSQDISGMVQLISIESSGTENFEDKLLIERNKNWIPQIIELARNTPSFFAVGAGHLAGPQGVILLLRKEGYKVTPVLSQTKP